MDRVRSAGSSKVSARRRRALIALALAVVLVSYSVPIPVSAADGSLDTSFGGDGKVTTDFFGGEDRVCRRDPGGRQDRRRGLLKLGPADFALARYNADGSLDTTFDTDGKLTTDFFGSDNARLPSPSSGRQDRRRRLCRHRHRQRLRPGPLQRRRQPGHHLRRRRQGHHRLRPRRR